MSLRTWASTLLLALPVQACSHDLGLRALDDSAARADAGSPGDGQHADGDSGRPDSMADASMEGGASEPFPYQWVKHTPASTEGYVSFTLGCERAGEPAVCPMECALDGARLGTCGGEQRVFVRPGEHEFCVTVFAGDDDASYAGQSEEQCVRWTAHELEDPFQWLVVEPSPDATELSLPLQCRQDPPRSPDDPPRDDCDFRCSIDSAPFDFCYSPFVWQGLTPGNHQLRVETTAPSGHPYEGVSKVRLLEFTIAQDAQPPVTVPPLELPPLVPEAELGELQPLLDAYVGFARACTYGASADSVYRAALHSFLSHGLSSSPIGASSGTIAACLAELEQRPAPCKFLPGVPEHQQAELMLPVRLPYGCSSLLSGTAPAGSRCITHADCSGICERKSAFDSERSGYGACGWDEPAEEGIMCLNRGCLPGLYCAGVCVRVNEPGAPCSPSRAGVDCPDGYTCSRVSPRVCVKATGRPGDACKYAHDCMSTRCDLVNQRCDE